MYYVYIFIMKYSNKSTLKETRYFTFVSAIDHVELYEMINK